MSSRFWFAFTKMLKNIQNLKLAPSALGVCRAIAGPRREKYGFLVEISAAFFRFKKDTQCYFWKTLTGGLKLRKIEGPFWSILKDLWQCESYPNYPTWHQKYGNLNHSTCRTKPQYGLKKGNSLKNQAKRKISKNRIFHKSFLKKRFENLTFSMFFQKYISP